MTENNTVSNTTLNVSLPEPLKEYVQERVSEGIYSNPSDYVRSLIREDMRQSANRRLETLMRKGINSGDPVVRHADMVPYIEALARGEHPERPTPISRDEA